LRSLGAEQTPGGAYCWRQRNRVPPAPLRHPLGVAVSHSTFERPARSKVAGARLVASDRDSKFNEGAKALRGNCKAAAGKMHSTSSGCPKKKLMTPKMTPQL
jgi:hypothetical protein